MKTIRLMDTESKDIDISIEDQILKGILTIPHGAKGLVLFVHGSGSSHKSPRNQSVARELNHALLGTLLFDLLSEKEEQIDLVTRQMRFDIDLLTRRLVSVIDWVRKHFPRLKLGLFGASTGAAAALKAAAQRPGDVYAVVSRGGRPDLAGDALNKVYAPTLLIVGSEDGIVLALNKQALRQLAGEKKMIVVTGATHLFEEPGKLHEVATLAEHWFSFCLAQKEGQEKYLDLL